VGGEGNESDLSFFATRKESNFVRALLLERKKDLLRESSPRNLRGLKKKKREGKEEKIFPARLPAEKRGSLLTTSVC